MTAAEVDLRHTAPGELLITVSGEIDLDNVAEVERELQATIENTTRSVELDLSGLEYIDSAGLRCLFTLSARLELLQVQLCFRVRRTSPARKAIEISGLDAVAAVSIV